MFSITTNSANETLEIGKKMAPYLNKGDVIVLLGDLGAGKTLFVYGLLDFYNNKEEASSPTFTIVNEYDLIDDLKLFHFDVYRLESSDEFLAIGGDEFFEKGICVIEWGDKISDVIPKDALIIKIEKDVDDINKRTICFNSSSNKYDNLIKEVTSKWKF